MKTIPEYFKKLFRPNFQDDDEEVIEPIVVDPKYIQQFYNTYDQSKIKTLYSFIDKNPAVIKNLRMYPAEGKIKYEEDILKLYIDVKSDVYRNYLITISNYFENYHLESNTFWTTDKSRIASFFDLGILKFKEIHCKLSFEIKKEDSEKLIKILLNGEKCEDGLFDKLCSKTKMFKTYNWVKYKFKLEKEYEKEEEIKHIERVTSMDLPDDWLNIFANDDSTKGVYANSIADALVLSLNNLGKVDIEYISQITGEEYKTVITSLRGSIYQNPDTWGECFYKGWETADEYLSGRIVEKWRRAVEANEKYHGYFQNNVDALEKIKPATININDIYVTLGSPWVPTTVIDSFIIEYFGKDWPRYFKNQNRNPNLFTRYDVLSGTWEIPSEWKTYYGYENSTKYGTFRIKGLRLLEQALNMKTPCITDTIVTPNGERSIVNKEETLLAREKQKEIIAEFQNWIWKDEKRKAQLVDIYYEKYCSNSIRQFDGSFLTFPEMNPEIELFDYQKNAVARIMFSPNTLLAHDVGAGKTFVMITAGMEKRRIGVSKKNVYVVPNNLVGQWTELFKTIYPNSNILSIEPKSFTPSKRIGMLKKIKDDDYDGIIIAYSCFGLIPLSKNFYVDKLKEQIDIVEARMKVIKKSAKDSLKRLKKLNEEREKLLDKIKDTDDMIYFDELGITALFVDEAHNFKNLPLETKSNKVLGINATGSKKCEEMLDKVHTVQKHNNGGGIVFATGTPITNSITDIFAMQKYLQNGQLSILNLQSFDSWIGMFAEQEVSFEIDVDTNSYRMANRFSKFHNMPELSVILSSITDFHNVDKSTGVPELDGYRDIIIKKTPEFNAYLQEISERADAVRSKKISRKKDNMLKITTDGRKAALDMRLVDAKLPFSYDSKVYNCADTVYNIYCKTDDTKSTQLVFCDSSTPKKGYNVYDALKVLLIKMGIPNNEIAYIHDVDTDEQRTKLFKQVQKGEKRVLIGSTPKLGLGVNVQDKLVALHHLDIPWRPSDMIQREGRILRKGNENDKVEIYRYITDGSFDAYSWQLLETKQKMIRDLLSGSMPKRMCEEIDDIVLNYAEIKAIAIGNPLLKERVETANELSKYYTLQKKYIEKRHRLEVELFNIPAKLEIQRKLIKNCKLDLKFYEENKVKYTNEERVEIRKTIFKGILDSVYKDEPTTVCNYQGFDIVVPNNVLQEKMMVYVVKNGRYPVEMGESEIGMLIRLDNFLDGFEEKITKEEATLKDLNLRKKNITLELEKEESYVDKIEKLKRKLARIDTKLGVKKDE